MGLKVKACPVFFLSLVGVDHYGTVDDHESIFDIYTRSYEFLTSDVSFKSAQDLKAYYDAQKKKTNRGNCFACTSGGESDDEELDIYSLVEFFVEQHPNAHYVLDEVPFMASECKCRNIPVNVTTASPFTVTFSSLK